MIDVSLWSTFCCRRVTNWTIMLADDYHFSSWTCKPCLYYCVRVSWEMQISGLMSCQYIYIYIYNNRWNLTFIGPCIANIVAEYNLYDATFRNLFISVRRSTCFRKGFPSIIRSSKQHIQRQVFVRPIPDAVCAILSSWWWTETCKASYRNK